MKVYLANQEGTNLYKIGVTKKNPNLRLKELQTGNANLLVLIETFSTKYNFKLETAMHAHFKSKQVNNEWFELTEEDVASFVEVCASTERAFDVLKEYENPFFK